MTLENGVAFIWEAQCYDCDEIFNPVVEDEDAPVEHEECQGFNTELLGAWYQGRAVKP